MQPSWLEARRNWPRWKHHILQSSKSPGVHKYTPKTFFTKHFPHSTLSTDLRVDVDGAAVLSVAGWQRASGKWRQAIPLPGAQQVHICAEDWFGTFRGPAHPGRSQPLEVHTYAPLGKRQGFIFVVVVCFSDF